MDLQRDLYRLDSYLSTSRKRLLSGRAGALSVEDYVRIDLNNALKQIQSGGSIFHTLSDYYELQKVVCVAIFVVCGLYHVETAFPLKMCKNSSVCHFKILHISLKCSV